MRLTQEERETLLKGAPQELSLISSSRSKGLLQEPVETKGEWDGSRFYWVAELGRYLPSVTTVISRGFPTSPGLIKWYKETDFKSIESKSDEGKGKGTEAHAAVEAFIKNGCRVSMVSLEDKRLIEGFLNWYNDVKPTFEMVERAIFYAEDGIEVAGRFDFIAIVNGERIMMDLKRSKSIYESYESQLALYAKAMGCKKAAILRLCEKNKKKFQYKEMNVEEGYEAFKAAYKLALYLGVNNKRPEPK